MNCRWPIWLGACLAAAGVHADDWVLTGLAREQGRVQAYLMASPGGTFLSLRPGEERWGWRLVEVSFRERCVWLADATRTVRVDSATSPAVASNYHPALRAPDTVPDHAGGVTDGIAEAQTVSPGVRLAAGTFTATPPSPIPAGGTAASPELTRPGADATSDPKAVRPRRAATADELFKARHGYGAWEALLRRRHDAAALGLPIPEN